MSIRGPEGDEDFTGLRRYLDLYGALVRSKSQGHCAQERIAE